MDLARRSAGLLGLVVLFAGAAAAQESSLGQFQSSVIIRSRQPVINAPYSATQETEHTQTLADGTHVVTKNHVQLYRDSAGRTRREMFLHEGAPNASDGPLGIMIEDPVAGVVYSLQPQNHTASMFDVAHPSLPRPSGGNGNIAPLPKTPSTRIPSKVVTEDLGYQTIDGLEAHGERTTRTIPTGAQGNDGPIMMTFENWYSEELKLQVLSKNFDPRFGETVTRITNLDRSEPNPALFQVPSDYTVIDPNKN